MGDSIDNPRSYTQFIAEAGPTQFECESPMKLVAEQHLTQGDVLGAIDGGLVGLFKSGGAKPVDGRLRNFIDVLTGKRQDLDGLWNMVGAIINDDIAVVREGAEPFTLAVAVGGQWLAIGTIRDGMTAVVSQMVHTGGSPTESVVQAKRLARRAEYDAALQREQDQRQRLREHAERCERVAEERALERQARRADNC